MPNRKFVRERARETSLPEMLTRLELASTGIPARKSVCRALLEVNKRLGSVGGKAFVSTNRSASPRRRQSAAESLPLFT